jgi:ferredoxin
MAQQAAVEKVEISENQKVRITIIPRFCKGCEICPKLCPTQVLGMGFQTLFLEPGADLEIADDGRIGAFGNGHGVADMIAVPV